jgi:hypothetical protein
MKLRMQNEMCSPTATERMALAEFKKYLRRGGLRGTYLAINLEPTVRDWLGLPVRREQFGIDGMPPHEVVRLQIYIASDFRERWSKKSQETRTRNRTRPLQQATFDFDGPQK